MYIRDSKCISPQPTYTNGIESEGIVEHSGTKYFAIEPKYNELIPAGQLRRIGKAVRMGIGAGLPLLKNNPKVDGMIIGSANGGLEDCISFLNQIIDYEEGTLTPTNFVQSTPNAVTGYLAITTKNHCYSNTHVQRGLAFENALLDASLLMEQDQAKSVLVGNIEEISSFNYNIDEKAGFFKAEETNSAQLIGSNTPGTVCGESATMFIVQAAKENALAEIIDTDQLHHPENGDISQKLEQFLRRNNLLHSDIDTLLLGYNGDFRTDHYYDHFKELFDDVSVYSYKNLCGEYPTASAFALWMATEAISGKQIPAQALMQKGSREIKTALIYNHYIGLEHGFILVRKI